MENAKTIAGILLLLAGCAAEPESQPDPSPLTACWTRAGQPLEFELNAGETWMGEARFTNRCEDARAISLSGDEPGFGAELAVVEAGPGETVAMPLSFTSDTPGAFDGRLTFEAGSGSVPGQLSLGYSLTVYGPTVEVFEVNPQGFAPAGCEYTRGVQLKNSGNMPLSISDIAIDSDAVQILNGDGTRQVAAGGTFLLELATQSDTPSVVEATLSMSTNVVAQPALSRLISIETTYQNPVSTSADLPAPQLDILLVMDRSACNTDHLRTMPEEVGQLQSSLRGYDYRAMVVVGDEGCIVGETQYIDDMTFADSASKAMATMADETFDLAPYGANTERHFTVAKAALEASDGCNAGVFRDDAFLHIIHQSDEPEQTPGPWQDQVAWFDSYADGRVMHHAVAGPAPSGCVSAQAGSGYIEAVEQTGGVFRNICDVDESGVRPAWDKHFDAFGSFMKQASDYRVTLDPPALPGTAVLTVNGVVVTSGWDVSESGERLTVSSATAPLGVSVQVRYQAAPDECL